jgi:hypothetical protein
LALLRELKLVHAARPLTESGIDRVAAPSGFASRRLAPVRGALRHPAGPREAPERGWSAEAAAEV